MKIGELAKKGITKIKKPCWNPKAYLELFLANKCYGPWGDLYDVGLKEPDQVFLLGDTATDWEEFKEVTL